jgi:uncharacterized protein (DUF1015 family)
LGDRRCGWDQIHRNAICNAFPFLYIADGHHRSAAAARVFQSRKGAGHSGHFLAVIFPHNQMQILPYNRVLKDLNNWTAGAIIGNSRAFLPSTRTARPSPRANTSFGLYMQGKWRNLGFRKKLTAPRNRLIRSMCRCCRNTCLSGFGIDDPRTSKRINFVGGIRGTAELEKLVNSGEYACAFSMFPTSIEDLMAIADAGGIMPPKSTWFEPKLRDAMFCHLIA